MCYSRLCAATGLVSLLILAGCGSTSKAADNPARPARVTSTNITTTRSTTTTATTTTTRPTTTTVAPCFSSAQAAAEIGQAGCVRFTVGNAYTSSSGQMYLNEFSNYASGFSVWIPAGNAFGAALLTMYANKTIVVSGTITSYNGAPEIVVTDASQVHLASG